MIQVEKTKVPQVKNKVFYSSKPFGKKGGYMKTMHDRVFRVRKVTQRVEEKMNKYDGEPTGHMETIYDFDCVFLDNGEELVMNPVITFTRVKVTKLHLIIYRIKQFLSKL